MQEIDFKLDSYQDLYSDFDNREYKRRSVSQDFLDELKRASKDKDYSKKTRIKLSIPRERRHNKTEMIITKRLKEHFRKHKESWQHEKNKIVKHGFLFVLGGIILMFLAALLSVKYIEGTFFKALTLIFLEPGGWFLFWEGLDLIIFESKKEKHSLDFYKKMCNSEIIFVDEKKHKK